MTMNISDDKSRIIADIRSVIQDVRDLPTLPTLALEVRRLVDDPSSNISDLVERVQQDIALSSRILRIANSAYYGIPRKVDNLKMAIVILGVREVVNLVTSVSVFKMFKEQNLAESMDIGEFWVHCATCAELTMGLYKVLKTNLPSSAYIAGLLHDIGKLVLSQHFQEYHDACIKYAAENKLRTVDAEIKLLGIDHGHIGSWLTQRWNIPEDITEAIAQHHIRPPDSPKTGLPSIIDWADRLYYLMKNRDRDETIKVLKAAPQWKAWYTDAQMPTSRVVDILFESWTKSMELVRILE